MILRRSLDMIQRGRRSRERIATVELSYPGVKLVGDAGS
jgi:hypothetical protein